MKPAEVHDLVAWAIQEIRELDEACRSMIPGFDPMLKSDEMEKLSRLEQLKKELAQGRWKRG